MRRSSAICSGILVLMFGAGAALVALAPPSERVLAPIVISPGTEGVPAGDGSAVPRSPGRTARDTARLLARLATHPQAGAPLLETLESQTAGDLDARLRRIAAGDGNRDARAVAMVLVVSHGGEYGVGDVLEILRDEPDAGLRRAGFLALAGGGETAVRELRATALSGDRPGDSEAAILSLGLLGTAEAHQALDETLASSGNDPVRRRMIYRAVAGRRPDDYPFNLPWFRSVIGPAAGLRADPMRPEPFRSLLARIAREPVAGLRPEAARTLARIPDATVDGLLAGMWRESPGDERSGIRRAIRGRATPGAIRALVENAPFVSDRSERLAALGVAEDLAYPGLAPRVAAWRDSEPDVELCARLDDLLLALHGPDGSR